MNNDIPRAKSMLSGMHDEVFNIWLEPLIDSYGWPFTSIDDNILNTDWYRLFVRIPLRKISEIIWSKVNSKITFESLTPDSKTTLYYIKEEHFGKGGTPISSITDSKYRFLKFCEYVKRTSTLPAPIVIIRTTSGNELVDGNHRLAAAFTICLDNDFLFDIWVGEHPDGPIDNTVKQDN